MTRFMMAAGAALALLASPVLAQDGTIFAAVGEACSDKTSPQAAVCMETIGDIPIRTITTMLAINFDQFLEANLLPTDGSVTPDTIIPVGTMIAAAAI